MPNRNTHLIVAGTIGAVTGFVAENSLNPGKENLTKIAVYSGTTSFGGILPDILEPATNPNHRSFFHSFAFGALIGWFSAKIWKNVKAKKDTNKVNVEVDVREIILLVVFFLAIGILIHLFMDGTTRKGLPLI